MSLEILFVSALDLEELRNSQNIPVGKSVSRTFGFKIVIGWTEELETITEKRLPPSFRILTRSRLALVVFDVEILKERQAQSMRIIIPHICATNSFVFICFIGCIRVPLSAGRWA